MQSDEMRRQMDLDHLRLLSIFHYVLGGLGLLFGLFPLMYVGMGWMMLSGAMPMHGAGGAPEPEVARAAGWVMIGIGLAFSAALMTMAVLVIIAGRMLSQQRRWMFCLVIACIQCLSVPFGTVLGVFTIIVLNRPGVKAMFDARRC